MKYIGEQPLWGQLGHFFVVLAFVTAIFTVVANFCRVKKIGNDDGWKFTARSLYFVHAFAVIGIFVTLLLMIIYHRFEYYYPWKHSKSDMSMNYVLACIWEGQEGSTLLWLIWHSVIGLILMRRAKDWEAPVMTFIALAQVFLSMMLLGVYFGKVHIGSSPFELIRMREENVGLPWTKLPDYLQRIPMFHDGRGLNPLLQNYWMTIHPPTLFLGFAMTTVPFAFAMAGLWTKRYTEWQKPALPWAFTGVMILGTGILMGGAWAYESLSFGGFWAWDPVENASFVPWLTLVGAAHVMLIYKIKGQSLFTSFFLCILTFLLIIYSTFLTKSGVLSDSSVHAFTDDGLNEELTVFMGFFLWLSVMLLTPNRMLQIVFTGCSIGVLIAFLMGHHAASMLVLLVLAIVFMILGYTSVRKERYSVPEEELWSREFWMFIGSLVLLLAAFQIIFWTSSPVINKFLKIGPVHSFAEKFHNATKFGWTQTLVDANMAPAVPNRIAYFYNRWQIAFAIIVSLLMAFSQFLKYRKSNIREIASKLLWPFVASVVITITLVLIIYFNDEWSQVSTDKRQIYSLCTILIFAALFSIFANGAYWIKTLKGKVKNAGASVAHIGFGLLLLGIVISTSKKDTISQNTSRFDVSAFGEDVSNKANLYLRKGDTLPMGPYMVTYSGHENKKINGTGYVYFNVDFLDSNGTKLEHKLRLSPFIQLNQFMGNAAEPDTRHYLHKDIYTFIKYVPPTSLDDTLAAEEAHNDQFDQPQNHTLAVGDTIGLENCIAVLDSVRNILSDSIPGMAVDTSKEYCIAAHFRLFDDNLQARHTTAYFFMDKQRGTTRQKDAIDNELGVKLTFWAVRPKENKIEVYSSIRRSKKPDYIVLEASIFPGINILWLGCLIMVAGTFIAVRERIRKNKVSSEE